MEDQLQEAKSQLLGLGEELPKKDLLKCIQREAVQDMYRGADPNDCIFRD
jgi:hypothetical protein